MEIEKLKKLMKDDWAEMLLIEFNMPYMRKLSRFISEERKSKTIYPPKGNVFRAFKETSFKDTKVVIISQDPYPHEASDGLAFSSCSPNFIPASLKSIFQELNDDIGKDTVLEPFACKDLTRWANQGVLLLNKILTVEQAKPLSHAGKGWEILFNRVIFLLSERNDPIIFLLWGAEAGKCKNWINLNKHFVLEAMHPVSVFYDEKNSNFLGCKHFSKTNEILDSLGKQQIKW